MTAGFDSHCHIHDFDDAHDTLSRARAAGIEGMVTVGTDLETSKRAVALAKTHPDVWAAVGLHPHDASRFDDEYIDLAALAITDGVVAVGETGFDLHYEYSPKKDQAEAFAAQIALAKQLELALVIHTREAWDDTFLVLVTEGMPDRTVFHCFTGGPKEAETALSLGAYLSFSGIVTFRNADDVRAAAAMTPDFRLLAETDAPYLAPEPHRGKRNEPMYVTDVVAGLAGVRNQAPDEVAALTSANARAVFGLA